MNQNKNIVKSENETAPSKEQKPNHKGTGKKRPYRGKQGRKDSESKRVNLDNERLSKFVKNMTDASNDLQWYASNPELLKSAATFSLYANTGVAFPNKAQALPGVMALKYMVCLGDDVAVNQAKDDIYSYTVHANSRNTSYTAEDQFMYIYAGKEVFRAIANLIRAYGTMRKYSQENIYTPTYLIQAMGFDFDDLQANYSHMLWDINLLIAQSHQIWIPSNMPVIARQFWMNSHVYKDSGSPKDQLYLYSPAGYWMISETASSEGTSLIRSQATTETSKLTWSTAINEVQNMINALINSEDRGIIFGDILKAFGEDKLYYLNEISSDYSIDYKYDVEVLHQIMNANVGIYTPDIIVQSQTDSSILESMKTTTTAYNFFVSNWMPDYRILNFKLDNPQPGDVMIASRLMNAGFKPILASNSGTQVIAGGKPTTSGTEVITSVKIWGPNGFGELDVTTWPTNTLSSSGSTSYVISLKAANFDWRPMTSIYGSFVAPTASNPDQKNEAEVYSGELANYTQIGIDVIQRLNRTATYSLYGIPTLKSVK